MTEDAFLDEPKNDVAALQTEIQKQQEEIRDLQLRIRALQAEIKGLRGSLSWRLTGPLRALAHRLPRVIAFGYRVFDWTKDLIASNLPRRTVQVLLDNRWQVKDDIEDRIAAYRAFSSGAQRKTVFYTAIYGEYDTLLLPERIDPDVDYVCFTDRPRNDYGVWQMRAAPFYHPDPTRIARWVKTHPHELFPSHDVAVWLDANIVLKGDVRWYIDLVRRGGAHLGLVSHPHRGCFYEEAKACKQLKKDSGKVIDAQVEHYRTHGLPLNQPLFETGFMVVPLKNKETAAALHSWWQQIERFSRRDQLGFAWVTHRFPDLKVAQLLPQGASVRDHEDFSYFRHKFARALIVPDVLVGLGRISNPLEGRAFSEVKDERLRPLAHVPIDIVVCVHNALEDVRLCLESVQAHLLPEHRIIIVNDCSDEATSAYLREFVSREGRAQLLENEQNLGYTRSANRGMGAGTAGFRILLNSDTIVSSNWALKLLDAASASERIGIVGPLSNAAGAQSIPSIKDTSNNTAINELPKGLGPSDIDLACERWSPADLLPRVPLVHGFCFGVKKEVIDAIGLFDEENFKLFYGEENDYCFRAGAAGFELAVATNTFVFHRKSRSIDEEKRLIHMAEAWKRLRDLYGAQTILKAHARVADHPLLERIRGEAKLYFRSAQEGLPEGKGKD
ncbi:glycosyltransferase [Microvirga roseola]|uniref:glycosyltransferase n=1 Tax=Microvirga roseola TaxID=2883126 RepID=UPI001E5B5E81|nr:glycosyltransferase [Microvirga roseola]